VRRALAIATGLLLCAAASASAQTPVVVWSTDSLVYAAWSEAEGARPGGRATAAGDTFEIAWSRDAIAALRPLRSGAKLPTRGAMLVALDVVPAPAVLPKGVLRVPIGSRPDALDPLYVATLGETQVAAQLFDGLVRPGPKLDVRPALAARWTVDGRRHRFTLREGAIFRSGRAIEARDVKASLERALRPSGTAGRVEALAAAIEGGRARLAGSADTISGVRVIDARTIEITASGPRADLLGALAMPAAFVVPAGTGPGPMDERALLAAQSGGFYVTGATERALHLAAAPGRSGGPAALDFVRLEDPAAAATAFELGRLDLVSAAQADETRLRAAAGENATVLTVDELATYYLGFGARRPFLAARDTRRALAGLVDRKLAVQVLVPGRGKLARSLLPPAFDASFSPPDTAWTMPRAEAERRVRGLVAAGAPRLEFWVPEGSAVGTRFAEFVAAGWRRAGLDVAIVVHPWNEFRRGVSEGRADAFYWSWYADGRDPVDFVTAMVGSLRTDGGGNRTGYASADVDKALAEARAATTEAAERAALRRAQLRALADAPLVPLFHPVNVTVVRTGVRGVPADPFGVPRYDAVEVP